MFAGAAVAPHRAAPGPSLRNVKKAGRWHGHGHPLFLLRRVAGKISHETGEGCGGGNRNALNVLPSFKAGEAGGTAFLPQTSSHPRGRRQSRGTPPLHPLGCRQDQAPTGPAGCRAKFGVAAGAERSPCKLVSLSLSLCVSPSLSVAAASLPGSKATFSVACSGAEIFSSLLFKCSEFLKLMLLHFDENNVFIIRLLFTRKM